jgi:uncharacterized protein (TIGR02421 family)
VTGSKKTKPRVEPNWVDEIRARIATGERVSRELPSGGRVHVERALPFLLIYRSTHDLDQGTDQLITSHPSYIVASSSARGRADLRRVVEAIVETQAAQFGAFLLLELWAGPKPSDTVSGLPPQPSFRILALEGASNDSVLDVLENELNSVRVSKRRPELHIQTSKRCAAGGASALLRTDHAASLNCQVYGLEVSPIYRDEKSGEPYPAVLRELRHHLTRALRRVLFRFSLQHTTHRPPHFHALGRRAIVKSVWETDRRIADVCDSFDFLLLVTPTNLDGAWSEFRRAKYKRAPSFHYRPIPVEPIALKRSLYRAPVERIDDPALGQLFREKMEEVDRQITMLQDRNTKRFLPGSIQVYGPVDSSLKSLAEEALATISPSSHRSAGSKGVDANAFAARAREEIELLRAQHPDLEAKVEIRPDIASVMVSRNTLFVGERWRVSQARMEALIQHEVGTHVLTYANGRAQPFRQLYSGLAGYEALQEGLAVLAEYLVGGLNRGRLRLLAARVVSVAALIEGASFVETFHLLHGTHGLPARTAFNVTMRTHRGGGLTKDAVYLKGLQQVLDHLGGGRALDELFIGKIAPAHIEIVRELQWRKVLNKPPLTPSYMAEDLPRERLAALRRGVSPLQLIDRSKL